MMVIYLLELIFFQIFGLTNLEDDVHHLISLRLPTTSIAVVELHLLHSNKVAQIQLSLFQHTQELAQAFSSVVGILQQMELAPIMQQGRQLLRVQM